MNDDFKALFKVHKFETRYDYYFKDPLLLCEALTHTSFANEYSQKTGERISHNERMEFLGDAVMGAVISTCIFKRFPHIPEGTLSRMRSAIVCEGSLAECFEENGLTEFLVLGKGEELTGGRRRPSVLSDCFEAIIGAIYLDGGFEAAQTYILKVMKHAIEKGVRNYNLSDAKTFLQEEVRKAGNFMPAYHLLHAEGPDHQRVFTVRVDVKAEEEDQQNPFAGVYGEGTGSSKKEAEQKAAMDFIQKGNI